MRTNILMLIIAATTFMGSSFPFVEGQVLNVVAPSGLKLRIAPQKDASTLRIIPPGDKVEVINASEITSIPDRISWMDGQWIYVEHRGVRGYVFDGFLSSLPMPNNDFEEIRSDFNITVPFECYVKNHLLDNEECDTLISNDSFTKLVYNDLKGIRLESTEEEFYYEVDVFIPEIRVSEIFNLFNNMAESRHEKKLLLENSIFIEGDQGFIKEIRINAGANTSIKKEENGVRIKSLIRYFDGC